MDLLELRKEIDRIDDQLIPLLMARMDVSEQVAKYKVERGIPVLNEERERQILDDVAGKIHIITAHSNKETVQSSNKSQFNNLFCIKLL